MADQSRDFQSSLAGGNSAGQNLEVFAVLKTSVAFRLATITTKRTLSLVPSRNTFLLRNYFADYVSFSSFFFILVVIIFL